MREMQVDVQKIMKEIRAEIAARGLVNDIPAMEIKKTINGLPQNTLPAPGVKQPKDALPANAAEEIAWLKNTQIQYYHDLDTNKGIMNPVYNFMKRVVRKLCKFLSLPILDDINEYHRHIVATLIHISEWQSRIMSKKLNIVTYDALKLRYDDHIKGYKLFSDAFYTHIAEERMIMEPYIVQEHRYKTLAERQAETIYLLEQRTASLHDLEAQYVDLSSRMARLQKDLLEANLKWLNEGKEENLRNDYVSKQ